MLRVGVKCASVQCASVQCASVQVCKCASVQVKISIA